MGCGFKPFAREISRQHAIHGRLAQVERLAHGAEGCIEPARRGARYAERVGDLPAIQPQQYGSGGCRSVAAKDRTWVKTLVLQHAPESASAQPRGNLKPGYERGQCFALSLGMRLSQRQRDGPGGPADVARTIEVGIVVIHAVRHGAVGQRGR